MKAKTISTKVFRPVLGALNAKLEKACLRRDAYLNRVLEVELPALDEELPFANSEQARRFIADHLDALDRKPVSLSLRPDLVERLDEICERKNVIRDSFFNRLFLFLAVPRNWFDDHFLLSQDWRMELVLSTGCAIEAGWVSIFEPLEADINPFWAIRRGLELSEDSSQLADYEDAQSGKTFKVRKEIGDRIAPRNGIYTVVLRRTSKGTDLWGFNCYLPDWAIEGLPEQAKYQEELLDWLRP